MSASTVFLGNTSPVMADGADAEVGNTVTVVQLREGWDNREEAELALTTDNDPVLAQIDRFVDAKAEVKIALLEIADAWQYHARAGDWPEWVEAENEELAEAVSNWFSARGHVCTVGRPDDWEMSDTVETALRAMEVPPIGGGAIHEHFEDVFSEEFRQNFRAHNLLTNGGRDALHAQHVGTAAQPAAFNYIALTANTTAESAASTTLTAEIVTGGGGLIRAQATYAHTAGTNTSTLTKTFTANGSDSLPVTIGKLGIFNASSAGTMGYEKLISPTATLSAVGDNVALTYTLTAG
jgi:hypothetical protein